jgi:hypothetical protein
MNNLSSAVNNLEWRRSKVLECRLHSSSIEDDNKEEESRELDYGDDHNEDNKDQRDNIIIYD